MTVPRQHRRDHTGPGLVPSVLVVGEALVDVVTGDDGGQVDHPGGSAANVAVALGRLGRPVHLATTLAPDRRGDAVRRWLEGSGVTVQATVPLAQRTSTAVVSLDQAGVPSYEFDLSWDLGAVDVSSADVLHVGSIASVLTPGADVVRDAVRGARRQALVSFDPNVRPALLSDRAAARGRVEELVPLSDVVKTSDEDLRWLFPDDDPLDVASRWATWGPGLVVVTRGGDGCSVVRPDGRRLDLPSRSVTVVDTVGAGDTFTGALLDGLLDMGVHGPHGRERLTTVSDAAVRWAVARAATSAAITVSRAGANPPTGEELAEAVGPVQPEPFRGAPVAGMTWGWTGVRGSWDGPEARRSMDELAGLDAVSWVALAYAAEQATAQSTTIEADAPPALSDEEVRNGIREARSRGWKVCLKPVVNCADGTWRGHIGFFDQDVPGEPTWDEWFDAYTAFVVHHAQIAAEEQVEMFCVGCEMVRTDVHDDRWRALVRQVREVYPGLLTYNCDKYQEDRLTWWDAVDVISSSGYYPSGTWEQHLDRIERVVAREGRPFVFLEAGCPSREGSASRPNDWTLPGAPSGQEQAAYLEEMFTACARRAWVSGFFLWDWPARLYPVDQAEQDDDYCVYGKPGAEVVTTAYRTMRSASGRPVGGAAAQAG